ncbi:MAG: molybdenum cofactor biosynthesis protein MoaB [Candidatus Omnitrophica bacterium]|nr:molybdenum cofactor biosynthesis protein MoaB [Candidatus Omnitrophota bacterium]MCB9720991.1 molybdenum cofactor biosynthesis protein MoaB [Candidatus Omnitrophota bacterium]
MSAETPQESSSAAHRAYAQHAGPVAFALVTVSDTRTESTDENGRYLKERIAALGHTVDSAHIVRDEARDIEAILAALQEGGARIIIFNGGTGIASRDRTFDVISRRLDKTLPGFGELFRMLSYEQVGAAAMLSRATAGTSQGKVIISVPGSPQAVRLAWEKLIAPECAHFAWELTR